MSTTYESPESFRMALTDRLRAEAAKRGIPIETLRTKVFIERLLARLFHDERAPWLLKGGYSFELRYRPRARTTRDIDLGVQNLSGIVAANRSAAIRDELQKAAELDLGDHIVFQIGSARHAVQGAPQGGATFPVEARIAGKQCAVFRLDVGFGDASFGKAEELVGDDLLSFANIPPARVRSISIPQQFAEKIHAYTFEWKGRENSRVKDLVDLLVLIERAQMDVDSLRAAIRATFDARTTHSTPRELSPPPESWRDEFRSLADEAQVEANELESAFEELSAYWARLRPTPG